MNLENHEVLALGATQQLLNGSEIDAMNSLVVLECVHWNPLTSIPLSFFMEGPVINRRFWTRVDLLFILQLPVLHSPQQACLGFGVSKIQGANVCNILQRAQSNSRK